MDEKDLEIIEMLAGNARVPFSAIAKHLGISDVAVLKRVKRLEREGVIKGYTVLVDPVKMGYRAISITGVDVEPDHLFTVLTRLREMESIRYLALTSGDHQVMAIVWARDSSELASVHEEVSKLPGVKRICPAVILEVVKQKPPF